MTSEHGVSSQDSRTRRCITCRVCNYMLAGNLILTAYRLIRRATKSRTIIRLSRKLPFPKDTTTREPRSFESSRWDNFRSVNLRHRSNSIERCYKIRGGVKTTRKSLQTVPWTAFHRKLLAEAYFFGSTRRRYFVLLIAMESTKRRIDVRERGRDARSFETCSF